MKLPIVLLLLLSTPQLALSKGNSTSSTSQCRELAALTALMDISSNATKLAMASHNSTEKAAAIQAKASAAASTLATLETNTTLVAICDQIFASEASKASCHRLARLERMAALAYNETTTSDALKSKASAQANALASLQSNGTLTTFCAALKTEENCKEMTHLQKVIDRAANATAEIGNSTRSERKVKMAEKKLAELKGNATLVGICGVSEEGKRVLRSEFFLFTHFPACLFSTRVRSSPVLARSTGSS
jgi:transcriptional regulator of acetoin/glycerol metabolism